MVNTKRKLSLLNKLRPQHSEHLNYQGQTFLNHVSQLSAKNKQGYDTACFQRYNGFKREQCPQSVLILTITSNISIQLSALTGL